MPYVTPAQIPAREVFDGRLKGHYAHLATMTLGEVHIAAGTELPAHQHPHEQIAYLISGRVRFVVGEETRLLEPGMAALIPGNVPHQATVLEDSVLLDVFSPVREDFR